MNVEQLIDLLGHANPKSKVRFEDVYGEGGETEITSIVWNEDEAVLTNE